MARVVNPNDKRLKANRQQPGIRSALLLSQAQNAQPVQTSEVFVDPDATANDGDFILDHTHYGRFPVYKLTPAGCVRLEVNAKSLSEVLSSPHYSDVCFDCGRPDCLYATTIRGEVSSNQCEGKAPKKFRLCPEPTCRKPIFDNKPTGQRLQDEFDHSDRGDLENDPNAIQDEMYDRSTPETRTRALMENHIVGYHKDLARELGLGQTPELREAVLA